MTSTEDEAAVSLGKEGEITGVSEMIRSSQDEVLNEGEITGISEMVRSSQGEVINEGEITEISEVVKSNGYQVTNKLLTDTVDETTAELNLKLPFSPFDQPAELLQLVSADCGDVVSSSKSTPLTTPRLIDLIPLPGLLHHHLGSGKRFTPDILSTMNRSRVTSGSCATLAGNGSAARRGRRCSEESLSTRLSQLNVRRQRGSVTPDATRTSRKFLKTAKDVAEFIRFGRAKKIIVMCGAGISTASGIPDFRSPGTGLYDNLQQYKIPYAEAIFDLDYFRLNPRPFIALAKELYPTGTYRPNLVHYFLLMLHRRGILHRIYTQNIDGLERLCGIPAEKLVEAHGSFFTAACVDCNHAHSPEDIKSTIMAGKIPLCTKSHCKGYVKPGIVFFGEDLPRRFYQYPADFSQADLLLVMGTSLQVQPFAGLVNSVRFDVPRILFNSKPVGPFAHRCARINDVIATGDIIDQLRLFVKALGWSEELDKLITEVQSLTPTFSSFCPETPATSSSQQTSSSKRPASATTPSRTLNLNEITRAPAGTELQMQRPTKLVTETRVCAIELKKVQRRQQQQQQQQPSRLTLPSLYEKPPSKPYRHGLWDNTNPQGRRHNLSSSSDSTTSDSCSSLSS